ncbi:MAG TPA: hypothetical protein VHQ47_18965 [Phycisphaerae bacterium]|jgi:hypothetical protein|nr:hypothetical protein [Phycisphaerae bacterium]
MPRHTFYLDTLLGRKVFDPDGRCAGRIEEIIAHTHDGQCEVEEFLLGTAGLFQRLSIAHVARHLLRLLGAHGHPASHRVPWRELDLQDPRRPRLRCSTASLKKIP